MNKQTIKKIWATTNILRSIPAIIAFNLSSQKPLIIKDIQRWVNCMKMQDLNYSFWQWLNWLLVYKKEFRNLFYYRIEKDNAALKIIKLFYKPLDTLFIDVEHIGGGLMIEHGFATIIYAKTIGENAMVFQQVTVGNSNGIPTIKDNVYIASGAVVIGNIEIGENSIIGANATVTKNVPPNCTVAGNPAYIIKRDGVKVYEKL